MVIQGSFFLTLGSFMVIQGSFRIPVSFLIPINNIYLSALTMPLDSNRAGNAVCTRGVKGTGSWLHSMMSKSRITNSDNTTAETVTT